MSGNVLTNDTDVDVETLTVTGFSVTGIATPFTAGQTANIAGIGTTGDRRQWRLHLHARPPITTARFRWPTYTVSDGTSHSQRHAHPERDPGERPRPPVPTRCSAAVRTSRSRVNTADFGLHRHRRRRFAVGGCASMPCPWWAYSGSTASTWSRARSSRARRSTPASSRYLPPADCRGRGPGQLQLQRARPGRPVRPAAQPHQLHPAAGERPRRWPMPTPPAPAKTRRSTSPPSTA